MTSNKGQKASKWVEKHQIPMMIKTTIKKAKNKKNIGVFWRAF